MKKEKNTNKQEKNTNTTNTKQETILETLKGLKSQDSAIDAIIKTAINAVKQADETAKKEAELTALAAVLDINTAELAVLDDDQIQTLSAVPDGQKSAVFTAFKMAATLAAENHALKMPKSAKKSAKKAEKLTCRQAYTCLQAFEALVYKYQAGPILLSALLAEPLRFLRCNLKSAVKTAAMADKYEASFRASYLSADYIQNLADFIGPRFIDDRNEVETALEEAVKQAKDELLKLVP